MTFLFNVKDVDVLSLDLLARLSSEEQERYIPLSIIFYTLKDGINAR